MCTRSWISTRLRYKFLHLGIDGRSALKHKCTRSISLLATITNPNALTQAKCKLLNLATKHSA